MQRVASCPKKTKTKSNTFCKARQAEVSNCSNRPASCLKAKGMMGFTGPYCKKTNGLAVFFVSFLKIYM
jgi:hypothetical protein